jgi:NhaP-type Na+/H+ or K+/H+ antiporter
MTKYTVCSRRPGLWPIIYKTSNSILRKSVESKGYVMLLMINIGALFTVLVVAVGVIILIRLLLLAGRLVRAIEKIAEKASKQT